MNPVRCEELDDYLGGELSGPRRALFESHLAGCAACREEAEQFRRLGALLVRAVGEEERADAECRTAALTVQIRQEVSRRQRRTRTRIVFGAAVLVLLGTLGWAVVGWLPPEIEGPGAGAVVDRREAPREDNVARSEPPRADAARGEPVADGLDGASVAPVVEVGFTSDVIAVPIETDDPSVTILWLYPTLGQVADGD